jgi:hypothetical protein
MRNNQAWRVLYRMQLVSRLTCKHETYHFVLLLLYVLPQLIFCIHFSRNSQPVAFKGNSSSQ